MGGWLTLKDSLFEYNSAPLGVAATFVGNGQLKVFNSTFRNNSAQAGTLFAMSAAAVLLVKDSKFYNNSASNGGGVLSFSGQSQFFFDRC